MQACFLVAAMSAPCELHLTNDWDELLAAAIPFSIVVTKINLRGDKRVRCEGVQYRDLWRQQGYTAQEPKRLEP